MDTWSQFNKPKNWFIVYKEYFTYNLTDQDIHYL